MMDVIDPTPTSSAILMLFVLVNPRTVDSLTAVAVVPSLCVALAAARAGAERCCLFVDDDDEGGIIRCRSRFSSFQPCVR